MAEQLRADQFKRVRPSDLLSGAGGENGVKNHGNFRIFLRQLAHPACQVRVAQQADFDGLDMAVRQDQTALGLYLRHWLRPESTQALGILKGEAGNYGYSVDAVGSSGLGIRLDAGTTARVMPAEAEDSGGLIGFFHRRVIVNQNQG